MNQEHRSNRADTGLHLIGFGSFGEPHPATARRRGGSDARPALRSITGALRSLQAVVGRWQQRRATRDALMRCSDRVLADIGIAREHIPLVAKGIDPAEHKRADSAVRRWWTNACARLAAALEARRERLQVYRELDAYTDRELDEIGLRRADIALIAREHPVLRRAA